MDALDGNAIAGELFAAFGREMTTAAGRCTSCGLATQVAELRVYSRAPGSVVRCPGCGSVVMVIVDVRGSIRVELAGFELLD
jgi:Family of unknown function (DUF6510)